MAVDLNTLNKAGEGVKAAPDMDFDSLPVGNYQMKIEECHFKPTKSGEYWMLAFKLRVLAGAHKGRIHFWNHVLNHNDETKITWYRRDIEKLGFPVGAGLGTIGDYTDRFCGLVVEINLKRGDKKNSNDEYPIFTRLGKVLDVNSVPSGGSGFAPAGNFAPPPTSPHEAPPPEDEIPF